MGVGADYRETADSIPENARSTRIREPYRLFGNTKGKITWG